MVVKFINDFKGNKDGWFANENKNMDKLVLGKEYTVFKLERNKIDEGDYRFWNKKWASDKYTLVGEDGNIYTFNSKTFKMARHFSPKWEIYVDEPEEEYTIFEVVSDEMPSQEELIKEYYKQVFNLRVNGIVRDSSKAIKEELIEVKKELEECREENDRLRGALNIERQSRIRSNECYFSCSQSCSNCIHFKNKWGGLDESPHMECELYGEGYCNGKHFARK